MMNDATGVALMAAVMGRRRGLNDPKNREGDPPEHRAERERGEKSA